MVQPTEQPLPNRRQVNPHPSPEYAEAVTVSRFWRNVEARNEHECWEWRGDTNKGYGVFTYRGRVRGAHELALSFSTGEKRHPNLDTCHSCDNPLCCNPAHLRFDTRQSNVDDMRQRGRAPVGDRAPNAGKLNSAIVQIIRERRELGAPQKVLAEQYGISPAYVSEIVRGRVWKTAPGPIQSKNNMYRKVAQ